MIKMAGFEPEVIGLVLATSMCTAASLLIAFWVIKMLMRWRENALFERAQEALLSMPESVRLGSDLVTDPPSNYEWLIGVYSVDEKKNTKTFLASGVIIHSHFLTCHHAIVESPKDSIYVRTHDNKFHKVTTWVEVETDVVAAPVAAGYKSAKVKPLSAPTHAKVIAAKESQNSSFGVLKHEREMCGGRVSYSGSTVSGFSGAPYTNGQQILGIHIGGGTQGNYGVSASLVYAALTRLRRPESSELIALERSLRMAKRSDVYLDVGQEEARVDVNGRFFYLDIDDFEKVLEDDRYLDYFMEGFDENGEMRYRRNWKQRQERYDEEPEYVPEGTNEPAGDASFLEQMPPQGSSTGASSADTDFQLTLMKQIQDMQISMEKAMSGHQTHLDELLKASMSMQENVEKRLLQCETQTQASLSSLEQRLSGLTELVQNVPPPSTTPTSANTSDPSSGPSTAPVPQASGSSRTTPPLVMHWDGMDSDLRKYQEWRSSRNVSHPDFATWREEFLTQLGLSREQKKALVNRFRNSRESSRYKRAKIAKSQPTTSSSS